MKSEVGKNLCVPGLEMLPDKGPGPEWVCLGLVAVCEFLTFCRKDFTTPVQVTVRIHLLRLGAGKKEEATGEPRPDCFSSLGSQRKGDFGVRFPGSGWDKLSVAHGLRVWETCACEERS